MKSFLLALAFLTSLLPCSKSSAADLYSVVYYEVASHNGNAEQSEWLTQAIFYASDLYGVDPLLVTSVMEQESGFQFGAVSGKGAVGLMQLMPDTASMIGVNPYQPLDNILGGVSYLRMQLDNFASCGAYAVTDAVAAYNAGGQAVRDYGGVPPYKETRSYVLAVAENYNRLLSYCD